jgi:hypothetical protein
LGAFSLLLILTALGDVLTTVFHYEWLDAVPEPGLPAPGDYNAWVRQGSPMDCLLTSQAARLSVNFGYQACFSSAETGLDIVVDRNTSITGDGREGRDLRVPARRFHAEGLPAEVGRRHFMDFIGASQRPEADPQCGSTTSHFVKLSFSCDGVSEKAIHFETTCLRWDRRILPQVEYHRAHGIIDVALSIMGSAPSEGTAPP